MMAQKKSAFSYRLGPAFSFGLSNISNNNVGLGGIAGIERRIHGIFAAEAEVSYNYFTGDKSMYASGNNKAFTLPAMLGAKAYLFPNAYVAARAGAVYFMLNEMSSSELRPACGLAAGANFPPKVNRINVQLGYNAFRYYGITRGYATLAAAIIIN
ncbi:MAG: hypothetical protein QM731_21175 [Chitinophagaceae bacterium]